MNFLKSSFCYFYIYFLHYLLFSLFFGKVFSYWNLEWLKSHLLLKSNTSNNGGLEKFTIPDLSGRIMSFVDYNDDKFTDIILFDEKMKKIIVYLWNNTSNEFNYGPYFQFDGEVVSLLTADWNEDGYIDILITYYLENRNNDENKYGITLLVQDPIYKELKQIWTLDNDEFITVQPLVIDINSDGLLDLLAESHNKRFVWVNKRENKQNVEKKDLINLITFKRYEWGEELSQWVDDSFLKGNYGRLVENHSSAFIDMDGDLRSDLVLEVYYENKDYDFDMNNLKPKGLEIWVHKLIDGVLKFTRHISKDQEFSDIIKPIKLPMGSGGILFSDFNRDGTIDLVVPICIMNENGCQSKSRLVFIPNIHDKECIETVDFSVSKYFGIDEISKYECKNSKISTKSSTFKIHSFTDEDDRIIFQDIELVSAEKSNPSFFSSFFKPKTIESNKITGTLYQGFTVSTLGEGNELDNDLNKNLINEEISEKTQSNSVVNQMASLFSFFPVKKDNDINLQWACDKSNSIVMSVGDYNLDGYPDILAVVKLPNNTRQSKLIENLPIFNEKEFNFTSNLTSIKNIEDHLKNKDKWQINIWDLTKSIFFWFSKFILKPDINSNTDLIYRRFEVSKLTDTFTQFSVDYAAFFDVFDDGFLDIISVSIPNKNLESEISIKFASSDNPSLFVKVKVLSYPLNLRNNDYKKIGATSFGTTVKIKIMGPIGNDIFMTATQLSQSTNRILQTPFVLFGLGQTNNYIEELYVGTNYIDSKLLNTKYSKLEYKTLFNEGSNLWQSNKNRFTYSNIWTGLIPNTQVVAQLFPVNNPSNWTLVLSVSPKKTIKGILIVSILALLIIGIIVLILDQKEKAEDLKEHQGFKSNFISA